MHFRRKHRRETGARGSSSDWVYPQVKKGDEARSRYGTKRRVTAFEQDLAEWMKDPAFKDRYDRVYAAVRDNDREALHAIFSEDADRQAAADYERVKALWDADSDTI